MELDAKTMRYQCFDLLIFLLSYRNKKENLDVKNLFSCRDFPYISYCSLKAVTLIPVHNLNALVKEVVSWKFNKNAISARDRLPFWI